jgi:hypothetical protein
MENENEIIDINIEKLTEENDLYRLVQNNLEIINPLYIESRYNEKESEARNKNKYQKH